jgi:hypothetical protein
MIISRRLETALQETIVAHAERYNGRVLDVEEILLALGTVSAITLAEVPRDRQRARLYKTFCTGTADHAARLVQKQARAPAMKS